MADMMKWKVLRHHEGDRSYREGEIRIGSKADLGHLVPRTLELIGPDTAAKSEPAPLNKAEGASPRTKPPSAARPSNGRSQATKGERR